MNFYNYKESCILVFYNIKLLYKTMWSKKEHNIKNKYFYFEQKLNWGTNNAMFYFVNF